MKKQAIILWLLILLLLLSGCHGLMNSEDDATITLKLPSSEPIIWESSSEPLEEASDEPQNSLEEVATHLFKFGRLPGTYITKSEARDLGWDAQEGNLWEVLYPFTIGGDPFQNREGRLPTAQGRQYYEADIDYQGGRRGAKRIVYSNDGLVFYTDDHYESFTQLYQEDYQ